MYYWAQMYARDVKSGQQYSTAKKAMMLNILNFNRTENENFCSNFTFYDAENKLRLSDKAQISFVELPKIRGIPEEQIGKDLRLAWAAFFNSETEEEFNMLTDATNNEYIHKAMTVIRELGADEKFRAEALSREEAIFERINATTTFYNQGKAEGRAEATAAFVKNLKAMGMPEEEIRKALSFADSKADDEIEDEDDYEPEM